MAGSFGTEQTPNTAMTRRMVTTLDGKLIMEIARDECTVIRRPPTAEEEAKYRAMQSQATAAAQAMPLDVPEEGSDTTAPPADKPAAGTARRGRRTTKKDKDAIEGPSSE